MRGLRRRKTRNKKNMRVFNICFLGFGRKCFWVFFFLGVFMFNLTSDGSSPTDFYLLFCLH